MQLFSVCKWPSKNILQRLQKRCRRVFLRLVNGFLQDFAKLSFNIEIISAVFQLDTILFDFFCLRHNAINSVMPICLALQNDIV